MLTDDSRTFAGFTGFIAVVIYLTWSFVPLPDQLNTLLHFAFGPILACAFVGIYEYLQSRRMRTLHSVIALYGIVAGCMFCLMTVVQRAVFRELGAAFQEAAGPEQELIRYAFRSGNLVQLGIDVVWDIFICSATVLLGIAIFGWGKVDRVLGIAAMLVGIATLFLNIASFPIPPAQSGLVDLGPAVGSWFGVWCSYLLYQSFCQARA